MTQITDNIESIDWINGATRKFMVELNARLETELASQIVSVSSGPMFMFMGEIYSIQTRTLSYQLDLIDTDHDQIQIQDELLEHAVESITKELKTIGAFHAYMPAVGIIVMDPTSFVPKISFSTRYAPTKFKNNILLSKEEWGWFWNERK